MFAATGFSNSELETDASACMWRYHAFAMARAWFQRLKLQYDELRSSFAFNFNVRLYIEVSEGNPMDKWRHVWVLPPPVGPTTLCSPRHRTPLILI